MQDNIIKNKEYQEGMLNGLKIITDEIRPTFGGSGTNIIVESPLPPGSLVTNDAQTIIQNLKFTGKAEKRMLALIQEMVNKTDKESGNARKTTILLADTILREGFAYEGDKNQLKRDLDALIPLIEREIDKQTTQISVDEVESVATTASENPETGKLLKEIYQKIGKDGIIHPESSGTFDTSYRFIDGVRLDMCGYLSPAMANQDKKVVYKKPLILITKRKIMTDEDINPLLYEMTAMMVERRPLVIFTNDMDSNVVSMLVELHKSGKLDICIIKAPSLWQDSIFEDFAKCTGATIVEDATGLNLKKLPLSALGTCDKIVVDTDETILTGTKDISEHIADLQSKGDEESKLRLSWLTKKTAILKLGSNSETDLSLKRLKCYDAIRSSQWALKYGIVKGGGICLAIVADNLPDTPAGQMLKKALKEPSLQQFLNSNSMIIPENVVDSAQTQKYAVRNAIGIASTVLTASSYIYIPEPTELEIKMMNKQQNAFT